MVRSIPSVWASIKYRAREQIVAKVRYPYLRLRGQSLANPHLNNYHKVQGEVLRQALAEILATVTGGRKIGVILEQGCGDGRHVTPVLKQLADQVWGVDLFPANEVSNCDRYVQVDTSLTDNHLADLPGSSVDVIMIVNYTGLHPHSKFNAVLSEHNERLWPYMQPSNFPRILKAGGHLVFVEWEARPEQRVGKRTAAEVNAAFDELYGTGELPGYTRITQGFHPTLYSAYLVYRSTR